MRILLDTQVLLWAMAEPSKLSPKARCMIDRSEAYVSAASIWEISIEVALRKLRANPSELLAALKPAGFSLLPISGSTRPRSLNFHCTIAIRSTVYSWREPMRLLSNDQVPRAYGECVVFA